MEKLMSSYESRRDTFHSTEETSKGRRKAQPIWPHASTSASSSSSGSSSSKSAKNYVPSPSELATFGLYFTPGASKEEADACTLYPDGDIVSGWKYGDVVTERIRAINAQAAFLLIHDSKEHGVQGSSEESIAWTWTEEQLLPTSKAITDARLRTFGSHWPYDGKKGWKPTSKKVSSAGFHFTPNEDEEDCVSGCYRECSLVGWEICDDPIKEHQKRRPNCPFFNSTLHKPKESSAKPRVVSAAAKQPRARAVSKRKARDEAEEEKQDKADDEKDERKDGAHAHTLDEQGTVVLAPLETLEEPKARSRSTSRSKKQIAATENDVGQKKTSSNSRKASRRAPANDEEADTVQAEQAVEDESKQAKSTEKNLSTPNGKEHKTANGSKKQRTSEAQELAPAKVESTSAGEHVPVHTDKKGDDVEMQASQRVHDDKATSTSTMNVDVLSIAPLLQIQHQLTPAQQEMTVEAWLKMHVEEACTEMERQGERRIERLREEIALGRSKIEAVLRGGNLTKSSSTSVVV